MTNPAPEPTPTAPPKAPEFTPPASQADLDRIVTERLAREKAKFADYDDLKSKASKLDELEAANKTELEKATARAEAAERERDEARTQSLRAQVAADKGVPAASLLGTTKEELEAKADELIAWRDADKKPKPKPAVGQLKSGATGDAEHTGRERAAAALRQLRGTQ